MKRFMLIATAMLVGSLPGVVLAQSYSGVGRSSSVIRSVSHGGIWGDYGSPSCGCAAPTCAAPTCAAPPSCSVPTCAAPPSCGTPIGCSAPVGCHSCKPCTPILCVIPCAIKKFGRALDCLLPCNKKCCGGCGISRPGFFPLRKKGCSSCVSCSTGCDSCSSGIPMNMPHSDPFIDDPAQQLTPPEPAKDVRRNPVWNTPTAARTAPVSMETVSPATVKVASRPVRSTTTVVRAMPSAPRHESSVLKRTSLEVEVEAEAPAAFFADEPRRIDSYVPVNPLR